MHGVINLLKPPGMTSHDAVSFIRRLAQTKKVGHTGTLDPAAAGVLPICIGNATRLADYLQAGRKRYIAEATFGYETDTLDDTGAVIAQGDASHLDKSALNQALAGFRGEIAQTPPLYSAIKQGGKKLYELARDGVEDVQIPARQVQIHELKLTRFEAGPQPRAVFDIECGSGTYVRSLLRDIGYAVNSYATMSFLVRAQSGAFAIAQAWTLEQLAGNCEAALVPFQQALESCAAASFTNDEILMEYLAGRTRRSHEAEKPYRKGELAGERLLFVNSEKTVALLSEAPSMAGQLDAKLFHLA